MTDAAPPDASLQRVVQERELYLGLLNLNVESDPVPFLEKALQLITGIVGAEQGYLELFDSDKTGHAWHYAAGFSESEVAEVRNRVSRGIIAEAVATGEVVLTPSALLDPRFSERASVRRSGIDSVLCAPIGRDPPRGVLYLHCSDSDTFRSSTMAQAETFAAHLAPLADQFMQRLRSANSNPVDPIRTRLRANDFVGASEALAHVLREVELAAPLDVGVLLTGETGTGKTQLGRLIHQNSPRASGPYVEVNCAAIPEQLVESELFGALPGAHSAAFRRVDGKIAAAQRGTLMLDEVGELSLPAQAKLLQLLQSREYFPLGSSRPATADVRIVAATNLDLEEPVAAKRFRQDLYYRLQVLVIRSPSLAERKEDVLNLAQHFREKACNTHRLSRVEFAPSALSALESSEWPGNVRQLHHLVEAATIRVAARGLQRIEASHLFGTEPGHAEAGVGTFQEETRRFQAKLIERTLKTVEWNVSEAARQLDITRSHMYSLIRSFGLARQE